MHFKDDPIRDIHAKNYFVIYGLKPFPGLSKFGSVFGPVLSGAVPSITTTQIYNKDHKFSDGSSGQKM